MSEITISSDESEGLFNEFIQDQLEEILDDVINRGDLDRIDDRGSDIIIEMDDIVPPTFIYGDDASGGGGAGSQGPGSEKGRLRFRIPFHSFMELVGHRLRLPHLVKEGDGRIKEVSYSFKTFGQVGVILDKRRTFKRALRSSIGLRVYDPARGLTSVQVRRRDRRFKVPQRIEKPRYKAVVFYMGDISYSTYGERLEMEKRLVNFIHQWLDFNYGGGNVEHRFFVHDVDAHEVAPSDFYKVSNAGGTRAAVVFDLVSQIAFNEYDTTATNFYAFYFGDGEVFEDDAKKIVEILSEQMKASFNRIGIVEVKPSQFSYLNREIKRQFEKDPIIRMGTLRQRAETVEVIKSLFGERRA
ncbi:MAG TPA: DUF444 family protein [Vicinamibacteria bacterium]|nr:DUF444 family protein [Vicinamibacteria bacterium]